MLTEERQSIIVNEVKKRGIVTVTSLVKLLNTSESTIRRDLTYLHKSGLIKKVHGGATEIPRKIGKEEDKAKEKKLINLNEKDKIARYAASLIEEKDIIYLDSGTTTELMIKYIDNKDIIVVTNGITHGKLLTERNIKTFMLGGEIKITTEAIIGSNAVNDLKKYNFTKGFFGTNGVCLESGFTTPEINEAMVKREAINKCDNVYILCDYTKFNNKSFITFCNMDEATIITDKIDAKEKYKEFEIITCN